MLRTYSELILLPTFEERFEYCKCNGSPMLRTYSELILLPTFEERFEYCKCNGSPSEITFGGHRVLNQILYSSPEWKRVRRQVLIRDNGCDLGIAERPLSKSALVHHLNPITIEQVTNHDPAVFDLNNLITVSLLTHNAIHYGALERLAPTSPVERKPNDQIPWK